MLTTFTVKTKSRLRGWIGGGKDVTRAENGVGVEVAAVPPYQTREGGLERVTFSHLRVLVTMILLDEAAATIVKPFPWVALGIFESFRDDLNHRPYQPARDRYIWIERKPIFEISVDHLNPVITLCNNNLYRG